MHSSNYFKRFEKFLDKIVEKKPQTQNYKDGDRRWPNGIHKVPSIGVRAKKSFWGGGGVEVRFPDNANVVGGSGGIRYHQFF